MSEETKRNVYRDFLLISTIITFLILIMIEFYLSLIIRMTAEQRIYFLLVAGLVSLGFLTAYIFFTLKELKNEIEGIDGAEGEDKIRKVERIVAIPFRFSFLAFWCWVLGVFLCTIIFYLFFGFSLVNSIEAFFLGICGGFFAPLLMYYFYKDRIRKFLKELKIEYKSYESFLSFSFTLKVILPFVISIVITFILIIILSLRMRDDLISGVLKKVGEKELSFIKTGSSEVIGGKITIDPGDVKGRIEERIVELSRKGKKIYIDPSTMNIFVFEKADEGKIESLVYSWKNLVMYPEPWNRTIWLLGIFSLCILISIPYLVIRDLKGSMEDMKNFLQKNEAPVPSDDEFNQIFFALLKFTENFGDKTKEMKEKAEVAEKRFLQLMESIKSIEDNLPFFEETISDIKKRIESERSDIASLRSFLNETKDFFTTGEEETKMVAGLKNKEISEEIIKLLQRSLKEEKEFSSFMKDLKKLKSSDFLKRIDNLREDSYGIKEIKETPSIYKKTSENISKVKSLLHSLDLKIVESKEVMEKFAMEIKWIASSIENVKGDSEKIGEIAKVIKEIIEETNLLSLNASIIAAQAGEKGKSFAVVAEEIKELAERTEMSTGEINEIVSELQRFIENSVDKMAEINKFTETFAKDCDYISEKLSLLASEIEKVDKSVKEASKFSDKIFAFCSDLGESISSIEEVFASIDSYEKYVEYLKNSTSLMEKALEFIITSQNLLNDQISFVSKVNEKGEKYQGKLEEIKNSFATIDLKISEIGNLLEKMVTMINSVKIKIKEVRS